MKVGIVGNPLKHTVVDAIERLISLEDVLPIDCRIHDDLKKYFKKSARIKKDRFYTEGRLVEESDILVAFGGDGTMLSAARIVGASGIPIVGINLGKLGFLAEISVDEMEHFIKDILHHRHVIEERTVLKVVVGKEKKVMYGLNDVVIDKSGSSRLIHISVYVDNDYLVSFPGDGIIISTPTGSSGYALAAGGPIVVPSTAACIIQPISPHSLSARTVIIPDGKVVRIVVEHISDEARVTADGQQFRTFKPPVNIYISKADHTIKLARKRNQSYYDTLRAKLLWGSDIRLLKR